MLPITFSTLSLIQLLDWFLVYGGFLIYRGLQNLTCQRLALVHVCTVPYSTTTEGSYMSPRQLGGDSCDS